jgi:hypothetical protein
MAADHEKPTREQPLAPVVLPTIAEVRRSRADADVIRELVPLVAGGAHGRSDRAAEAHLVLWASRAGLLCRSEAAFEATAKGALFATDPIGAYDDVVDVVRDTGALTLRALSMRRQPDVVERLLDENTLAILAVLYVAEGPVPVQELARLATDPADAEMAVDSDLEWDFHRVLPFVGLMMDALAFAGLVAWRERRTIPQGPTLADRPDGTVALTGAGVDTTRRWLVEAGYEVPIAETMTGASATQLLASLEHGARTGFERHSRDWMAARSAAQAVEELVEAVRLVADPGVRAVAGAMLAEVGLEIAEPLVRELATEPRTRAFAATWLVEHDLEDARGLYREEDLDFFVEVLTVQLVGNPDDAFLDTLALVGSHAQQIALLGRIAAHDSSDDLLVLGGVAELHPSRAVAKAALRALTRRRAENPRPDD